jgi:antitoxin MazE
MAHTEATFGTWGNSVAIRIPKQILSQAGFSEDSTVTFSASPNVLILRKKKPHIPLAERIAGYTGDFHGELFDWGEDVGREIIDWGEDEV